MPEVRADNQRRVSAGVETVHAYLADYRQRHRILPENYLDYEVVEGGAGEGTVVTYRLRAGGRERSYRMRIQEPSPGLAITESDTESSLINTWTLTPMGGETLVRIETRWKGASGIGGFFERRFAPKGVSRIQAALLEGLARELERSEP